LQILRNKLEVFFLREIGAVLVNFAQHCFVVCFLLENATKIAHRLLLEFYCVRTLWMAPISNESFKFRKSSAPTHSFRAKIHRDTKYFRKQFTCFFIQRKACIGDPALPVYGIIIKRQYFRVQR